MKNQPLGAYSNELKSPVFCAGISFFSAEFLFTMFAFFLTGCVENPTERKSQSNLSTPVLNPNVASATVTVSTQRFEALKGDIPVLSIAYSGADSVDVWRCRASYTLVYGNGLQKLSDLSASSAEYRSAARESFGRMSGDLSSCRSIAVGTPGQKVTDYAANEGKFYYVINPCVSENASATKKSGCSFKLVVTETLDYKNTRTDYEVEVLSGLSSAEGRMYGNFNEMRRTLEEANESMNNCIRQKAENQAYQTQLTGLIKLVSAVAIVPVVNGLIAGAGTALGAAINTIVNITNAQEPQQLDCPGYTDKMSTYADLKGKISEVSQEVLAARKKLSEFDSLYINVEKEIAELKKAQK